MWRSVHHLDVTPPKIYIWKGGLSMLELTDVHYMVDEKKILNHISLSIQQGEFVGIIGPNGSGKSTMLKIIYRHLKQTSGKVTLHEQEIWQMAPKRVAQQMAVVSQESPLLFDFTVQDLVLMGRTPYKNWLTPDRKEDFAIVEESMVQADVGHLANRTLQELSGGEKKRVMLARALAQQAKILILDEPTNHLDIAHQLQLMKLVKNLPITIIAALHDLNLAVTYCDELLVMQNCELVLQGIPKEVITEQTLQHVFQVEAKVATNPFTQKQHIYYLNYREE